MTVVDDPYAWSIGGKGGRMLARETDPQKLAKALDFLRSQVATDSAARNPYANIVIGDTPGGAQSALLNLRGQNIQIEQDAARRAEAARQFELQRRQAAQQAQINNAFQSLSLQRAFQNDAADRAAKQQEMELRRLLGIGNIEADIAKYTNARMPPDLSQLQELLPYGQRISAAEVENETALGKLLSELAANARKVATERDLLLKFNSEGSPSYGFLNPANLPPGVGAKDLLAAEDAAWQVGNRDLRAELNKLLQEQTRLTAGRANYEDDLKLAKSLISQRTQVPEVPAELVNALKVLQQFNPMAPAAPALTPAQQLLARSAPAASTSRRTEMPAPRKTVWTLKNGKVTRG